MLPGHIYAPVSYLSGPFCYTIYSMVCCFTPQSTAKVMSGSWSVNLTTPFLLGKPCEDPESFVRGGPNS